MKPLCSIPGRSSPDFGKIKIFSKHLLTQGDRVLARASLISVKVQCRPDSPGEKLSIDVGPSENLAPHWLFQVGAEPLSHAQNSSPQFDIRYCDHSYFVLLSQNCYSYLWSFLIPYEFLKCLFYICEICYWYCNRGCIESINRFT